MSSSTPSLLVTVIDKLCLYCLDMFYDVDLISGVARGAGRRGGLPLVAIRRERQKWHLTTFGVGKISTL